MRKEAIMERFFTSLISGNRPACRELVDQMIDAELPATTILSELFWPVLEHIQNMYRNDQLAAISFNFATRMLRTLADQMQMRLPMAESRGQSAIVFTGPEESEEIGGQMVADLLEADGYDVYYLGGGVANDEIVSKVAELNIDKLVVFGVVPSTVPFTRLLIDHMHDIGSCPKVQICVGGGVFNRAEGLAEEIGADLWASTPMELVEEMSANPMQRMDDEQRTVGRKRRTKMAA